MRTLALLLVVLAWFGAAFAGPTSLAACASLDAGAAPSHSMASDCVCADGWCQLANSSGCANCAAVDAGIITDAPALVASAKTQTLALTASRPGLVPSPADPPPKTSSD